MVHLTQSNRIIHDFVPVAEAKSRLRGHAGDRSYGSGEAANAAQIALGSDAENKKGRYLYSVGQRTGARTPRLPNRPRKAEKSRQVPWMPNDPRNQNT
jgi:hypothetical protein